MALRLNGATSGFVEIDAPDEAGSNTLVLPNGNGAANQILKNGATAGTLEYGLALPTGNGTSGQYLQTDGSGGSSWQPALQQGSVITVGTAVDSTSGTAIDFTGIPAWVKRITVMFNGVSTNGTSPVGIAPGTSAGFATSGYTGGASNQSPTYTANTNCLLVNPTNLATAKHRGHAVLTLISSNDWVFSAAIQIGTTNLAGAAGAISLSGTLDRVRITTVNGTDTFDAGSINIMYEG